MIKSNRWHQQHLEQSKDVDVERMLANILKLFRKSLCMDSYR